VGYIGSENRVYAAVSNLPVPAKLKANVRGASPFLEPLLLPSGCDFGQAYLLVPVYVALDHVDPLPCHLL
jgi:hypothetical protein